MTPQRGRRHRRVLAGAMAAGLLGAAITVAAVEPTVAFWRDAEVGTPALEAGRVLPATGLSCSGGLAGITFTWGAPTGGLARAKWTWTYEGLLGNRSGEVGAGVTSQRITTLLGVNQVFSVRAVTAGGWTSQRWTAIVSSVVVGAVTCTIAGPIP